MLDKIASIEARYAELGQLLELHAQEYQRVVEYAKERSDIEPIVLKAAEYRAVLKQIEEAQSLEIIDDPELRELASADLVTLLPRSEALEKELKTMLVPKDPRDERNVIVEIRAGAGGEEAALFAGELFRIYVRYAEKRRWTVEIISQNETGIGGFKEVIFNVLGKGAILD